MIKLSKEMQQQFDKMCQTGKLFRANVPGSEIWRLYLASFTKEEDPVFRDPNSSVHNCNLCNNFIRRYGNIVAIDEGKLMSIFDVEAEGDFTNVVKVLSEKIKSAPIQEVFFETFDSLNSLPYESCNKRNEVFQLGVAKNVKRYTKEEAEKFGVVKPNEIRTFNHFHLSLPKQFVDMSGRSVEQIVGAYRDKYQVFKRAMNEIPLDTLELVRDLINQGSLLDGTAHLHAVEKAIDYAKQFLPVKTIPEIVDNWFWSITYNMSEQEAKFKNTLVGVLCTELAEGVELNKACENWNKRVDPINYHKATAPITKRQIAEAKKFVEENGYEESFNRRFAILDDIKVSEVLHSNVGDGSIPSVNIFDGIKSTSTRHKRSEFDKVEEIGIEKFMTDILPTCTSVEAYLENRMEGNLVTLTTANNPDSKKIFKWNNNYSWTFNGNLAGKSQIKQAVKDRGGQVEAEVRISMHFPDTTDDYDLHLLEPGGFEIYYPNRRSLSRLGGMLDLDAQGTDGHFPPDKRVENIVYPSISTMRDGDYKVWNHNYSGRGVHTSFTVETEIEGDITTLKLKKGLKRDAQIGVITKRRNNIDFKPSPDMEVVESKTVSREVWGLETNNFHRVNLVCLSPNHWGDNKVGNKHYMFMLDKCKSPTSVRSFHNENLSAGLLTHRKVMEVLGATKMLEPTDKQLCGLGFNSTVRDDLIVKVSGTHKRMLKIKF